jgi:tetratricopeptide (TPR) repeat protein
MESRPGLVTSRRTAVSNRAWIVPLLIAVATFVAFLPSLGNGFVSWDDDKNFRDNQHFRGLGPAQLHWMWTTFHMGHYVPLSWMTLGLDYTLWGMNPTGYHLTSLLIHAANAVLVYAVARRLFLTSGWPRLAGRGDLVTLGAACAALLFAIHPLRVESVAWATERRDVLSAFFSLSAILAYLGAADASRGRRKYWGAVVLFACALLSKATSMTVPAVLLILNVYPLRRIGGAVGWWSAGAQRVYRELLPFAILASGAAVLSIVALHPPGQLGFGQKLAVSAYSLAFYVWKTVVPVGLSSLYQMPQRVDPSGVIFVLSYAVVLGLIVAAWFARRRAPAITAAIAAFVTITLPMLGVVQNGPQIAADRYTYHAAPALALLAATAFLSLPHPRAVISIAGLAALVVTLGALTWSQTEVWNSPETLWSHALELDSTSSIAQSAMANIRFKQDRVDEGIALSERAVALAPDYAEAHNDLGVGFSRQNRLPEAMREFRRALAIKPEYDEAENDLGIALSRSGEVDSAIVHFRRALEIDPDNASAEINWGNALVRVERPAEAIPHYERALTLSPGNVEAHLNWGVALAKEGKFADAAEQFRAVLAIDPNNTDAKDYLARAAALLRNTPPGR